MIVICLLFAAYGFSPRDHDVGRPGLSDISGLIQKRFFSAGNPPEITIRNERLLAAELIEDFYRKKDYQPAWIGAEGPSAKAESLIETISNAGREGLTPGYYHLTAIKTLLTDILGSQKEKRLPSPDMLADLEMLLTDAYLLLGCHFSAGCVDPLTLEAEWFIQRDELDMTSVLEKALREDRISESLESLLPKQSEYSKLKQKLLIYREIAAKGGWPVVPEGSAIKKGMKNNRVIALRKRLVISGYLDPIESIKGKLYDRALERAVIRFQRLHGLETDGIVGHGTLRELNIPAEVRVRMIELNMERLRWLSGNLGQNYIKVNIADYRLDVVEANHSVLNMKVIVGKPFWHTPVFSKKMRYLILNPPWNVPKSIAVAEIIPRLRKEGLGYLKKENMKLLKGWGENEVEIDPASIDWSAMSEDTFKYRFRQDPGNLNPLGKIKFMLPNRFGVYLHDTPGKRFFKRSVRSFSHGCIRLEKPLDLAVYVLKKDPKWTREKLLSDIERGQTKEVRLPQPLSIHILYMTAWVDEDGLLNFRDDIYGRDIKLDEALKQHPAVL